jgi:hypothetical protein
MVERGLVCCRCRCWWRWLGAAAACCALPLLLLPLLLLPLQFAARWRCRCLGEPPASTGHCSGPPTPGGGLTGGRCCHVRLQRPLDAPRVEQACAGRPGEPRRQAVGRVEPASPPGRGWLKPRRRGTAHWRRMRAKIAWRVFSRDCALRQLFSPPYSRACALPDIFGCPACCDVQLRRVTGESGWFVGGLN